MVSPAVTAPPIFLFGFERSGTTLLSMMAGAHPDLAVPLSTTGLWYRYDRILDRYNDIASQADLERLIDDLLGEERITLWDATFERGEVLDGLPTGSFAAVVERFHSLYAQKKGKPRWGNIDIATIEDMDRANAWFPDARFVHIVRDGRDVALSHMTMPYGESNIGECAEHWNRTVGTNLKMGAILGSARYMVVRYEDLVADSENTLARMCGFMGLEYFPEMLRYTEMVDDKIPDDRRWLWPEINQPPDSSKVSGWKKRMSTDQRIVFEWQACNLLRELEYETFDSPPKRVSAYGLELWYFLGRGHRFRRLAERLGIRRRSKLEREWQGEVKS